MRVALVRELGGPDVLVPAELPDPVAGLAEVVIDVSDVDTLFVETQIRSGAFRDYFPVVPPYGPGGGIADTVRTVGEGVDASWTGRRVIASPGFAGGYAEQAVAPTDHLVPVADGLGLREAAALVHDGVTAAALVEATAPNPANAY